MFRDPFLKGPETFSHPKSHSKISNLMITELFYSHTLYTNSGSLLTRSFRRINLSVFRFRLTKNGFAGPKRFLGFRETGFWAGLFKARFSYPRISENFAPSFVTFRWGFLLTLLVLQFNWIWIISMQTTQNISSEKHFYTKKGNNSVKF